MSSFLENSRQTPCQDIDLRNCLQIMQRISFEVIYSANEFQFELSSVSLLLSSPLANMVTLPITPPPQPRPTTTHQKAHSYHPYLTILQIHRGTVIFEHVAPQSPRLVTVSPPARAAHIHESRVHIAFARARSPPALYNPLHRYRHPAYTHTHMHWEQQTREREREDIATRASRARSPIYGPQAGPALTVSAGYSSACARRERG